MTTNQTQNQEALLFSTGGQLSRAMVSVQGRAPLGVDMDIDACYCLDAPVFLPQGYATNWAGTAVHRFVLRDE